MGIPSMGGKMNWIDEIYIKSEYLQRKDGSFVADIATNHVTLNAQDTADIFVGHSRVWLRRSGC